MSDFGRGGVTGNNYRTSRANELGMRSAGQIAENQGLSRVGADPNRDTAPSIYGQDFRRNLLRHTLDQFHDALVELLMNPWIPFCGDVGLGIEL